MQMNYPEMENVVKHLKKTSKCLQCGSGYDLEDISIIASTKTEGLFETRCKKCECSTIVTVMLAPELEIKNQKMKEASQARTHGGISQNDILDMKNFLNNFDGNFKKIFSKK